MSEQSTQVEVKSKLPKMGLFVSIFSLFISFYGLLALLSIVLCLVAYTNYHTDKNARFYSLLGIVLGTASLLYSYLIMVN